MKKIGCLLILVMLCGCQSKTMSVVRNIDDKDTITVVVDNQEYARALKKQWDKRYPKAVDAICMKVEPYYFTQDIKGDIIWTNDLDAPFLLDLLQPIQDVSYTYDIPEQLQREELLEYYIPVFGEGTLFVYNEKKMNEKQLTTEDLQSFESLQHKNVTYYHNHLEDYIYPFLTSMFPKDAMVSINDSMQVEEVVNQLQEYKELYQTSGWEDDVLMQRDFYKSYVCGLLSTKFSYEKSEAYKHGDLHFAPMPTWKNESLHPPFVTFGFALTKQCKNVETAKAFLELTRSKAGIQAMIDANVKLPVLMEDKIEDFTIYDHAQKEMIAASNKSVLYNQTMIQENPGVSMEDIWNGSDVISIIQNYICGNDSAQVTTQKLKEEIKRYVEHN